MAKDEAIGRPQPSRSRRLLDAGLPAAAIVVIGFSTLAVSVLLASVARDFTATPFSASYAPGRNPWMATSADGRDRPSANAAATAAAVAYRPEDMALPSSP